MSNEALPITNLEPSRQEFLDDVLQGMRCEQKALPSKYFYDRRGCKLFDQICDLEEYYPTRTELSIMEENIESMAELVGPGCRLVELGSGSSVKTRILLQHLPRPVTYVPVDIARGHLQDTASQLASRFDDVDVGPVCADFTQSFSLPEMPEDLNRTVVYFPGSTIGNFTPSEAASLLNSISDRAGDEGGLLIGFDLKKDTSVLEAAYNDDLGVTAEFNRNLLHRMNRELEGDFQVDEFAHEAFYDAQHGRIEMHLKSLRQQTVQVCGEQFEFEEHETIRTEYSHKYDVEEFAEFALQFELQLARHWTDEQELFAVAYFEVA